MKANKNGGELVLTHECETDCMSLESLRERLAHDSNIGFDYADKRFLRINLEKPSLVACILTEEELVQISQLINELLIYVKDTSGQTSVTSPSEEMLLKSSVVLVRLQERMIAQKKP